MRYIAAALLVALVAGCAGLSHKVDRSLLDDVPNEEKLILFDAENGVLIAKDEAELADKRQREARQALDRARRYRDVIAERRQSGASIDTAEVLGLLDQWNDARIAVREKEVDLAETTRKTADVRLWAARARYERAKAKLVKDFDPERGNDIKVEDFDQQVTEWQAKEAEVDAVVAAAQAELTEARTAYNLLSTQLVTASKGAYGGPWADLLE
jgi:hypothetical protein